MDPVSSSRNKIIRFAAGTPQQPMSLLWRLVVNGNDAYIGANGQLMGLFKLSLHAREWLAGFTRQSGVVIPEKGGRHSDRWRRPAEFAPGWTRGPIIAVPHMPPHLGTHGLGEAIPKAVQWMPAAGPGDLVAFATFFVRASIPREHWADLAASGGRVLGGVVKRDGEAVVLLARHQRMEDVYRLSCEQLLAKERFTYRGQPDPTVGGSLLWVSTQAGLPSIADLPAPIDWVP
jgi:hypothetical protein